MERKQRGTMLVFLLAEANVNDWPFMVASNILMAGVIVEKLRGPLRGNVVPISGVFVLLREDLVHSEALNSRDSETSWDNHAKNSHPVKNQYPVQCIPSSCLWYVTSATTLTVKLAHHGNLALEDDINGFQALAHGTISVLEAGRTTSQGETGTYNDPMVWPSSEPHCGTLEADSCGQPLKSGKEAE
ncbi:hypothetical protein Syun_002415 [Stephania yunnanensis]|uniref:Uncharacterized protein n=1 Tax=Stephania yunnanensis TaxID=152371 RepID=A0AAP0Q7E6_9MAGN